MARELSVVTLRRIDANANTIGSDRDLVESITFHSLLENSMELSDICINNDTNENRVFVNRRMIKGRESTRIRRKSKSCNIYRYVPFGLMGQSGFELARSNFARRPKLSGLKSILVYFSLRLQPLLRKIHAGYFARDPVIRPSSNPLRRGNIRQ